MLLCFIFISLFSKYVLKNKIRIKNELLFGNNLIKRRTYWHWNKQPVKNIKIILWVSCYYSTHHSSKKSKAELLWMNEWTIVSFMSTVDMRYVYQLISILFTCVNHDICVIVVFLFFRKQKKCNLKIIIIIYRLIQESGNCINFKEFFSSIPWSGSGVPKTSNTWVWYEVCNS